MIAQAFVRQFAAGQKIDLDVADQEVILHYALARLNEIGLVGYQPGEQTPGPLLFKGGTALRKCIFGSTGRFSQEVAQREATQAVHSSRSKPDSPNGGSPVWLGSRWSAADRERVCAFASDSISALDFQEQAPRFSAWIRWAPSSTFSSNEARSPQRLR